jgi:polysaccharide export outer membrane protein
MDLVIAPDGTITYPLIGRVRLSGMTTTEAVAALSAAISTYYREPQVSLNVTEVRSQKVLVVGEVTTPSVLQLEDQMTILEALAHSGGINSSARTDNILLIRGGLEQPELLLVDVRGALAEGRVDQLIYLQRGDIIVVPTRSITNLSRYFREIQSVLAPFVAGSAIFRNAVSGGAQGTSSVLE